MTRSHVLPRDAAAIAGIGQTEFSRDAGRTELQLASEAIVAACADAQIDVGEVDGLVSYTIDPVEETELVRSVGLQEIGYSARVPYGGGGSIGVLMHAAAADRGRRRRHRRRLPRGASALRRDALRRRQGHCRDRRQHARGDDREPVVHAARRRSHRRRGWH